MPYTGSTLTPDDIVDQYIVSPERGRVCLQNGTDSACLLTLVPRREVSTDGINAPIIHIYPSRLTYMFYYQGKQIVHAERVMDTSEIVEAIADARENPLLSSPGVQNTTGDNRVDPPLPLPRRVPTTFEKSRGDGQSAEINQYLTNPLVIKVLDQHGVPLPGVTVNFTVNPSDGVLSPVRATTGSNGEVSTTLQLGSTVGTYTVIANIPGIVQQVTFTATATEPPRATTLEVVSGDNQSGEINQHVTSPLVVRVLDQYGAALSGVTVTFFVSPGGVLNPTNATTGADGEASTILRLGSTAGRYNITASVSEIAQSVTFRATATDPPPPPPPSRIPTTLEAVSGDGQTNEINQYLSNPLVVRVLDQHNVALSGVTVDFSVNPATGVLSLASATTGSNGETSTTLQLGSTVGTYTVTASVSGIPQNVSFTATAIEPPRPARLEKVSGDAQSKEAYQYLTNPLVVKVLDQYGAALSGVTVSFTVNNDGVLTPGSTTTGSDGEASTLLRFSKTTGTYTVTVTASGITGSVTFTATATTRPTDSDWAQRSHYYDANEFKQGWLVHIYYPENYQGPRQTPDEIDDAGFLVNGFMLIPSDGATVTEFAQTSVDCWEPDKPCNSLGPGDPAKQGVPTSYSVQIFLETTLDQTSFQVIWDRSAANWSDSSPPPDMTYNLMASKNLMTGDQSDPNHTQQ